MTPRRCITWLPPDVADARGTRAVEIITGQPGSVKTSTTKITVWWTGGLMVPWPRDPRDWAAFALALPVLGHDNVSTLPAGRQDQICAAATGDSHLARALYTDADLFAADFQPVTTVINGVELSAFRTDLIRRVVPHHLIKPDGYIGEADASARWQAAHPAALGFLCDTLCQVLAVRDRVPRPAAPSLQDFAWLLATLDAMWNTHALELWLGGQQGLYRDLVESDTLALAVMETITGAFEGTAADLLRRLQGAGPLPPAGPGARWTPRLVSSRLDRCQAALEACGWKVERPADLHTKNRRIGLWPPGNGRS